MGRLLLIINKILGSKHLAVNRALALVDSRHLITSKALLDSRRLLVSQIGGSSHLPPSRILLGRPLVTSTTSVARPLATNRALADNSRLTVKPALVSLVASRIHRVLLSNSSLAVQANLSSLLHNRLILGHCETSSPGKHQLLTSTGPEAPNKIKVNHSLVKIRLLFRILGSLVNSKA